MADLIQVRAVDQGVEGLGWQFVDSDLVGYRIELDQPIRPDMQVQAGDVWQAHVVRRQNSPRNKRRVILRLVTRVQQVQLFEKLNEIPGFWMPSEDLRCVLIWLCQGCNVILIGDKGTGKSTFGYKLASAMGWQAPCKVEIAAAKRAEQLFGSNAAENGSTLFRRSSLLDYLERAMLAHEAGLSARFLVILDEWNRAHATVKAPLHGCFDDTRQVTIPTEEGSRTIIIPPNVSFIATANVGSQYAGTFSMDEADKSRFVPVRIHSMPLDFEVNLLIKETGVLETQALKIVQVARALRRAATNHLISYGPSYREVRATAWLVKYGLELRPAVIKGMLGYCDGERDERGGAVDLNSEYAKALTALAMKAA